VSNLVTKLNGIERICLTMAEHTTRFRLVAHERVEPRRPLSVVSPVATIRGLGLESRDVPLATNAPQQTAHTERPPSAAASPKSDQVLCSGGCETRRGGKIGLGENLHLAVERHQAELDC
jgi:hypothetical protein